MSFRFGLFILSTVLLFGCSGGAQVAMVSYDPGADRSTYETKSYTVTTGSESGYGSSQSITMRVIARCRGQDCTPETAQFVFSVDGGERLSVSGVNGEILADKTEIRWSNSEANRGFASVGEDKVLEVLGEFATVDIEISRLQKIATATSLTGSIGGKSLDLDSDVQSGFRALLQKMELETSDRTAATPSS